ncbi:MAG: hypothetical protein IT385_13270 [Deltaproteobacteria bacterium]|nr:hypothetical protein [Deltaproteobacteria bacterium]
MTPLPLALALLVAAPAEPPRAPVVTDAAAIASGDRHACAVKKDGAVVCWGDGRFHQAGQVKGRPVTPQDGVVTVRGVDDAVAIAAGYTTTCLMRKSRELVCLGSRHGGMSDDPYPPLLPVPVTVYPAARWARSFAVGGVRVAVASAAGEVDFFAAPTAAPIPAADFEGAVEVAVGWENVCARDATGGVRCFGPNYGGENGNGGDGENREPVTVLAPREPTPEVLEHAYAFCRIGDDCHTPLGGAVDLDMFGRMACAALADGRVACWGGNGESSAMNLGKLGFARVPILVPGLRDAVQVEVGGDFVCARKRGGEVSCWGDNDHGQLGAPGPARGEPRAVGGIGSAVAISAGDHHACALDAAGAVRCWGAVAPPRPE